MKAKTCLIAAVVVLCTFFALCAGAEAHKIPVADTIYFNGTILTMDHSNSTAEAVAIQGEKILTVGHLVQVLHHWGHDTKFVNLHGRTMIPGFYDAHSHFAAAGQSYLLKVDLNSPPIGTMASIEAYITALGAKAQNTPAGQWIQGWGYDDTLVPEMRHPTKEDLDRVSTVHPIWIGHISGHLGVANSLALQLAGVTAATQDLAGGVIRKDSNGNPNGVLEESAMGLVTGKIPPFTEEERLAAIAYAAQVYAAKGVTTANDGATILQGIADFQKAVSQQRLPIRVMIWPYFFFAQAAHNIDPGTNMLSIGGAKIIADGSIQGYTGYLSEPYYVQPAGMTGYRGYPAYTRAQLAGIVKPLHDAGLQIYIHGNGDAAIDDILYAYAEAEKNSTHTVRELRHVVVHSQMAREDQLDKMKQLGVLPSFFVLHTYYWGDRHRDIFMGPERAFRMSPGRTALDRGIKITIHCDTMVVPQDPMRLMWAAVNRISTSGQVIGAPQRITPLEALRAYTSSAAYENHEEKIKGSLEAGKLADLAILSHNPLQCNRLAIKDIKVLKTVVGGKVVYDSKVPF